MNQTVENLGSFALIIAVFMIVAGVITATFNYILRKRLIESGKFDENSMKILAKAGETKLQNIKWGFLCFFGGLGLVVIDFLPPRGDDSTLPYGIEAIFLAAGFILYYFFASRKK